MTRGIEELAAPLLMAAESGLSKKRTVARSALASTPGGSVPAAFTSIRQPSGMLSSTLASFPRSPSPHSRSTSPLPLQRMNMSSDRKSSIAKLISSRYDESDSRRIFTKSELMRVESGQKVGSHLFKNMTGEALDKALQQSSTDAVLVEADRPTAM